jgi:hypothetical protein
MGAMQTYFGNRAHFGQCPMDYLRRLGAASIDLIAKKPHHCARLFCTLFAGWRECRYFPVFACNALGGLRNLSPMIGSLAVLQSCSNVGQAFSTH